MSARLSSADAAWLHMDRPTNLMVINAVLLFDEPVDWERVKQITQGRILDRYPRFHQRVCESRIPVLGPKWEEDPDFALQHHMHHLALPAPGDDGALQELLGDLMTMPLDHSRPLWHTYMVDGYGDGAALICRMHHCIADGIALGRVLLSMTDSEPEAGPEADPGAPGRSRGLLAGAVRQGVSIVTSPSRLAEVVGSAARDGGTVLRLLLTPADPTTAIKGDPGISRRVAWSKRLSLRQIKKIARTHDATVNDVLLAAVSGALRHYLQDRGSPVAEIQAMVPFNLRPREEPIPRDLGNRFGLVFLPLPVGVSDSRRRLMEVHRRMDEIKHSRDGAVSYGLLGVAGHTPEPVERRIVDLFSAKGTAVMTNVPGPGKPVYLAGTPVRSVLFWAPTSGHIGMSVSIFSYRGEVTVGLMVDAALIPDPGRIVAAIERELRALGRRERTGEGRVREAARRDGLATLKSRGPLQTT
jgi:WS/DGAT/MGAT family acyltransferase